MIVSPSVKNLRIAVIDDNTLMLQQMQLLLKQFNVASVDLYTDGRTCMQDISAGQNFDIIFVDLLMPEFDGIEVIRGLAEMTMNATVVLLSGEDRRVLKTAENLARLRNLSVLGAIAKPIAKQELVDLLNKQASYLAKPEKHSNVSVTIEALRFAIENGQIVPFYQAKMSTNTQEIVSCEALARWQSPENGLIMPNDFIPLAEQHGLINDLTFSLIKQIFNDMRHWLNAGKTIGISINISTYSLEHLDFPEKLEALVNTYKIPIEYITLELTESRLMDNLTSCLDDLLRLRLKGFRLSVDDFGTGYSSNILLNQVPFTELKIDRAFVHGCSRDPDLHAILESHVELAKRLGLLTVAEGVEDSADIPMLLATGVDFIQGYFVAKPMAMKQFELFV